MPRYFFHRVNGAQSDPDREGVELPSLADAKYEAVSFAADTLRHDAFRLWDGGEVRVEVLDHAGARVFSILISVVDEMVKLSTEGAGTCPSA